MSRDDDAPRRRPSRDEDERPRSRDRDADRDPPRRSSSRDDDDRSSRSRGRDDNDRGGRGRDRDDDRGGRSGYVYQRRDDADTARRAQGNSKFDKYLNPDIKLYKPKEGTNIIRILPPTWPGAKHYGYDAWVHFGVGADSQTYLCLNKMVKAANEYFERAKVTDKNGDICEADGSDPVEEESLALRRDGDEELAKKIQHKLRVGIYLVDRDNEKDGVQFWLMGEQNDREIVQQSTDKRKGKALAIDDPEDGYDISFIRKGTGQNTKYSGISVDRDPSPLGNDRWLKWAMDNPIPEQLIYYPYEHIKAALGGGGEHVAKRDRDDDRGSSRGGRDRDEDRGDRSRSGGRDDDRSSRSSRDDTDSRGGRGRDDTPQRRPSRDDDTPTWESIHAMSMREMKDLVENERLDIDPKEAKDEDDLADWICDEMKLKKADKPARRSVADDPADERAAKMDRMRNSRD